MLLQITVHLLYFIIQGTTLKMLFIHLTWSKLWRCLWHALTKFIDFIRASPSEFVIPLAKYNKAMYTQVSLGMRFRMMFETEESGVRRYMGTITGISELDAARWKNSQWRNLQVFWCQLWAYVNEDWFLKLHCW